MVGDPSHNVFTQIQRTEEIKKAIKKKVPLVKGVLGSAIEDHLRDGDVDKLHKLVTGNRFKNAPTPQDAINMLPADLAVGLNFDSSRIRPNKGRRIIDSTRGLGG